MMKNKFPLRGPVWGMIFALAVMAACVHPGQENTGVEMVPASDIAGTGSEQRPSNESLSPASLPNTQENPPSVINPLTGLPATDAALLDRRPVMVKVSNFPREGRPHAGLSFADIVFDYFIGYGTNRFLAVFYGNDAYKIGPVRSGRLVDAQLVTMYSGILGYGSADENTDTELVGKLGQYALSHLEADCPVFCGTDTHGATGVYANSAAISDHISTLGLENEQPDLHGMVFDPAFPRGGKPAQEAHILFNYYNRGEWRYDAPSGSYLRWIEDMEDDAEEFEMIPLMDRLTGEQLAFNNIIVLLTPYTELAPSAHAIDMWGNKTGLPAYFFRDGILLQGSWKTTNPSDPIQFFDQDGEAMALKPGNSWIVLAGLSSSFKEINDGVWEMFFFLP